MLKDKGTLHVFSIAYNVTDELFCNITISLTYNYLPYSIFLAQPLFMGASARELLVPWYGAAMGI